MSLGSEATLAFQLFWLPLFGWIGQRGLVVAVVLGLAFLAAHRASVRGISPLLPANQIALGLLISVPMVAQLLYMLLAPGGATTLGLLGAQSLMLALVGILLGVAVALRGRRQTLLTWLDVCAPVVLLGLTLTHLLANLDVAGQESMLAAGLGPSAYPALHEALLPPLAALGALLWVERRARGALRPGDSALLCGLLYALGQLIVVGLHAYGGCIGLELAVGDCAGGLTLAWQISLAGLGIWLAALVARQRGRATPARG
ncbi:MAG TPA: hypothetical protein PKD53_23855 [Chloroflexaceae bacterium]|nr:hypothetical protein [Chloroflexaceae bacterium]